MLRLTERARAEVAEGPIGESDRHGFQHRVVLGLAGGSALARRAARLTVHVDPDGSTRHNRRVIASVFFDVGETIVDESREYGTWADWLGVPRHTFSAVFGAVIARGLDYRETFQVFRPGFDLTEERERRTAAGQPESFTEEDLYLDARPCLAALRESGLQVGLAGNQTARAETILRALDLPVDVIGTSDGWGVEKPSAAFFDRVVAEAGCSADQVLYVGDRLDNDIRPAQEAGIATALVRRGPWGYILGDKEVSDRCLFQLDSLVELPDLVRKRNESAR